MEALLLSDALTETRRILSGNLIFAMANLGSFLVITALLILQMMRHPSFTLPPYLLMIQCSLTAILGIWKSRLKKKALERGAFLRMVHARGGRSPLFAVCLHLCRGRADDTEPHLADPGRRPPARRWSGCGRRGGSPGSLPSPLRCPGSCHGHPALYFRYAQPGRVYHLEAAHRPAATPARHPRTLSSI